MQTSQKGIAIIKSYEGLKLSAYLCPAGKWTIGYGHTRTANQGMRISSYQANELLAQDLQEVESFIIQQALNITQNQFDALVSFAFNVGIGNLQKSELLRLVKNNPRDHAISAEFGRWVYANGIVLQGLVNRRASEADLYFQ